MGWAELAGGSRHGLVVFERELRVVCDCVVVRSGGGRALCVARLPCSAAETKGQTKGTEQRRRCASSTGTQSPFDSGLLSPMQGALLFFQYFHFLVEGKTRECREKHVSTWAREASSWFENHRDQGPGNRQRTHRDLLLTSHTLYVALSSFPFASARVLCQLSGHTSCSR